MKYLLTFHVDQSRAADSSPAEMNEAMERWNAFDRDAVDAGALIACEPLQDAATATTIEFTESGERVTTDGPFAESKEQLGGFCVLECADLDEALSWANKVPLGAGYIQVSTVQDLSQYGFESSTVEPVKAAA
jgi:hypothetical protein